MDKRSPRFGQWATYFANLNHLMNKRREATTVGEWMRGTAEIKQFQEKWADVFTPPEEQ